MVREDHLFKAYEGVSVGCLDGHDGFFRGAALVPHAGRFAPVDHQPLFIFAQKVHGGQVKIGILPGEPIGVWKTDGHHIRRVRNRGADLIQCIKLSVVSCVADKNGPVGIAAAEIGLLLTGILQDHIFLIAAAKALVRKGVADEFDFSGGKADLGQEV